MSVQDIATYSFKNTFSLSVVDFDDACVVSKPEQIDAYSIYWIKEGKGTYNIDFKSYSFDGNILFFLSPGQVFSVTSEKIKEAYLLTFVRDFYCIQTHDKEVSCNGVLFNNIYETPYIQPTASESIKLSFILESLVEELKNTATAQYDMLQSYLKQFIVHSVRISGAQGVLKEDAQTKLLKDFSLLVDQNFHKIHSVTEYAARLGVSPKSLSKNFQKNGSQKPSDYIKSRIILEAKRQLVYTDASVKHIAYNLGFNDAAYFTRFFSKSVDKSPLQFKKDYKK